MFLSDIPRALVRCWYVVLVGLLATGALVYGATKVTAKEYTVVGEVLLLPPPTSVPAGDNPYLALSGLDAVGDILARAMQDGQSMTPMKAAGLTSEVTFTRDQNSAAPMMLLTTVAKSPEAATRDSGIFLAQLPATLKAVQQSANVPQNAYVSSTVIVKPDEVTVSSKSQTRTILVAAVAGLLFTLLLTAAVDRLLSRRSGGRRRSAGTHGRIDRRSRPLPRPPATPPSGRPDMRTSDEAALRPRRDSHLSEDHPAEVRDPLAGSVR